ncbi:MAG: DNA-3-methyladenine glycosylase I [Thermovirgaceae bacterium]|nr:DNA-3-methyladenine glycosylase I [Thermovirgaceae bacterium]
MPERCPWSESHPLLLEYHDTEWGVPLHDDQKLFEFLVLEAFQAGLSWLIILKKRERFREAFHGFDPEKVARYGDEEINRLLAAEGIIRNRQKITATVSNARAFLELRDREGSFASWMWRFVDDVPILNRWKSQSEMPPETELSGKISKEFRGRGFRFLGPVVTYSHMQAVGMVNDHIVDCFRYGEVSSSSSSSSSRERSSTPARDSI